MLEQRKRIRLREHYSAWLAAVLEAFPVRRAPVDFDIAERAQHLTIEGCDPADHIIAATALERELTLVTADERLLDLNWLSAMQA